jgi:DNA-binding SARP family transcriptional activator
MQHRSAELLEASDHVEEAVELYSNSNDITRLIQLLHKQAKALIIQGRHKTLEQWIKRIPDEALNKNPWMLYWLGVSCQHFPSARAKDYFENAFHLFKHGQDIAGLYLSWSGIIDSIANEWNYFTEFDPWIEWLENHTRFESSFPSQEIEAKVTVCMTFALLIRRPDHPHIIQWIEKALSLSREIGNINLYMQAIDWAMTYYAWIGDFDKVEIIREESKELAKSYRTSPAMLIHWKWIDVSVRACTMENIDSALKDVSDALAIVKETGLYVWEHIFFMPGIFISLLIGDLSTANVFLKRFEALLDISHYHGFGVFHHFSSLYNLHIGNIPQARAHAETALKISDETGYVFAAMVCGFQLAYTLYKFGEVQKAEEELSRAYDIAIKTKSQVFEFMCLMAKAMIALDQGKEKEGLNLLRKAMSLGRKHNYMNMVWWWHPAIMAKLCAKALTASIEVEYVQKLIRVHKLVLESPPHHIENWPWQLKINTFGLFQIMKEGKPLQFTGKAQKMPLELLMVLISYGGVEVSIEKIMDALWYETDGDMARSAFSTTLNRLRNLIGIKEAIQLQAGKVTLDKNYFWVDVWAFVRTLDEAEALWEKGERQEAIARYEKAITLYKGHFLAEESEEPWMIPLRERLKSKFLDAILKLGECWEQEEAFENAIACYEKGLAIDNLEEIFYQRLMKCFYNLGHHAEAIKVYKQCKDALNEFLGIRPSYETEAIYKKIVKVDVVSYNE